MPRLRKTRAKQMQSKPKLKNNDPSGLSEDTRKDRLEAYLSDFDVEVDSMKREYLVAQGHQEKRISKIYHNLLSELSPQQRKMTVEDYIASLVEDEPSVIADETDSPTKSEEPPTVFKEDVKNATATVLSKYKVHHIDTIHEEEGSSQTHQTVRANRKAPAKWTTVNGKLQSVTFGEVPSSTKSQRNNRFVTPAMQRNASALGWDTPLVTPKFDPRLPVTPGTLRRPRAGETLMSIQGSPVAPSDFDVQEELENVTIPDESQIDDFIQNPEKLVELMKVFSKIQKKFDTDST